MPDRRPSLLSYVVYHSSGPPSVGEHRVVLYYYLLLRSADPSALFFALCNEMTQARKAMFDAVGIYRRAATTPTTMAARDPPVLTPAPVKGAMGLLLGVGP